MAEGIPSTIYEELTRHQLAEPWHYRAVAEDLHRWWGIFASHFKLEIPAAPLRLTSHLNIRRLGQFQCSHNDFGLLNEIAISLSHIRECLRDGTWWRVLGTLLHEQLHLWQQTHGQPGVGNYHNAEYQARAAAAGLLVDRRGHTRFAAQSPFMDLLKEHGVAVPALPAVPKRGAGNSTLKKWTCGCTNVRVAIAHFRALCLNCDRPFAPADFEA